MSVVGEPRRRPFTRRKIQRWIKEQYEPAFMLDMAARRIRQANLDKIATSRMQRPARVS